MNKNFIISLDVINALVQYICHKDQPVINLLNTLNTLPEHVVDPVNAKPDVVEPS